MMNQKGNFLSQEEVKAMIKLSTPSNFRSGKEIFDKGGIEMIEFTNDKIIANISEGRKVEFISSSNGLQWNYTCKKYPKKFCKHAVALGLEIIKSCVK